MAQILLIADDLTGSNDSGVQFVRHGFGAAVFFAGQPVTDAADVIVVDTDSRGRSPREAYDRTRQAADRLAGTRPALVYKKIDSTLRGNLGAETDAALDAFCLPVALVAPAFPRIGRTTQEGIQFLHGTPVHETEIGRDPKAPVRTSAILDLLSGQSHRRAGRLTLADLRSGAGAQRIAALMDEGVSLVVCDAVSEEDLHQVAAAGRMLGQPVLWVGSAGLADVLPDALGLTPSRALAAEDDGTVDGPVLVAVGSVSDTSRGQLADVLSRSDVTGVEVDTLTLVAGDSAAEAEIARCVAAGRAALEAGRNLALYSSVAAGAVARTQAAGQALGLTPTACSELVAAAMGRIGGQLCRETFVGGLVLTGGDTAQAVCQAIGATGINLLREVAPGIPLGRLVASRPYGAITKAGAFGTAQALSLAIDSLRKGVHQNV